MIKTISLYDFEDAFNNSDTYKNNFSYEGKKALFEYLENYEEDTGEDIELDIVALCCDYTEYDSFEELQKQYPNIKDFEELNENTQVIEVDNAMKTDSFIIANF